MRSFWFTCVLVFVLAGCSQSPEAKAAKYLEKGKKEFQNKKYNVAVLHFKTAAAAQPRKPEPYFQLGLAYLALNDVNAAGRSFRQATELDPKHLGAQVKLASLLAMSNSREAVEDAEKRIRGVLATSPGDLDALNVLAIIELRQGKAESAEAHLREALQKSPGHLQSSVALAQVRLFRKNFAGAEDVLRQAGQHNAKSPEPRMHLGIFYVGQGRVFDAEKQFRDAVAIDSKHGPSLLALATLLVKTNRKPEAEEVYRRVSQLPEEQYRTAYALFLFQSGKSDQGIAELVKLAAAYPTDRDVRTELVRAYLASNRVSEAEKALSAALKNNGRDVDALLQRARVYLSAGKHVEAHGDLNQVLHYRSDSAEAHYLLAKVSQARENPTIQKQELGEALRLQPGYLLARIELAEALLKAGGAQSALQLLDDAPIDQRQNLLVVLHRNWALLALERFADARKGIDAVLAAGNVPEAVLQDAALRSVQKDYAGARAAAEEVLKANPTDVRALSAMMESYSAQKQFSAGLTRLREHAVTQPNSPEVNQYLGQVLARTGDRMGARSAFEVALKARSGFLPAELALAELDMREGKRDEARKRLAGVISAHPSSIPARLLLGQVEVAGGKMTDAMKQYRQVVDLDPKNAGALNNVAYILADSSQPDEALKYAQQAKELAPENPHVDDTLGWTYYKKGMYKLAVTHLESAAARQGGAVSRYHLAMAYLKAGDPKRARQTLEAALKIDPNLPEAEAARRLTAGVR